MMKTLTTTAVIFSTLILTSCTVGYGGGPLSRLIHCQSTRNCAPVTRCDSGSSSDGAATVDQPSELNIILTTELVALRQKLKELDATLASKDKEIEEFQALVSKHEEESKKLTESSSREAKRADQAEAQLVSAREMAGKAAENSRVAAAKAKERIQKLTKQNATLNSRLKKTTNDLKKANRAASNEKKKKDQNDRQEKAVESTPVAAKEDDAEAPQESASDQNGDKGPDADEKNNR